MFRRIGSVRLLPVVVAIPQAAELERVRATVDGEVVGERERLAFAQPRSGKAAESAGSDAAIEAGKLVQLVRVRIEFREREAQRSRVVQILVRICP